MAAPTPQNKSQYKPGLEVVDNIVNRGLGPTMKRGYEEALKEGADIIVQLDADGQYLAKEIPLLIQLSMDTPYLNKVKIS